MRPPRSSDAPIDALFAELLQSGKSTAGIVEFLRVHDPDDLAMVALLRRAVPVLFLEYLGTRAPWSERRRVLGGVAANPATPRGLALRILPALFWRDLAEIAASPRIATTVRVRAEGSLKEMLPELRLGERIALAKIATPGLLPRLLADAEAKVLRAALDSPRLREEDLLIALRRPEASRALIEEVAASRRWRESYATRLELVLQPRTPLALALGQISSLLDRDLERVAATPGLAPLVQAAAERLAGRRKSSGEA